MASCWPGTTAASRAREGPFGIGERSNSQASDAPGCPPGSPGTVGGSHTGWGWGSPGPFSAYRHPCLKTSRPCAWPGKARKDRVAILGSKFGGQWCTPVEVRKSFSIPQMLRIRLFCSAGRVPTMMSCWSGEAPSLKVTARLSTPLRGGCFLPSVCLSSPTDGTLGGHSRSSPRPAQTWIFDQTQVPA